MPVGAQDILSLRAKTNLVSHYLKVFEDVARISLELSMVQT